MSGGSSDDGNGGGVESGDGAGGAQLPTGAVQQRCHCSHTTTSAAAAAAVSCTAASLTAACPHCKVPRSSGGGADTWATNNILCCEDCQIAAAGLTSRQRAMVAFASTLLLNSNTAKQAGSSNDSRGKTNAGSNCSKRGDPAQK